jgi:hypothetical protein
LSRRKRETPMLHIDPWEKVAECERYLQAAGDSTHRKILTDVRDLWIGLANARNFLTAAEFDQQVETLNSVQADLIKVH